MLSGLACQSHVEPDGEDITERLPLSLEHVREISGFDEFTREVDTDEPVGDDYTPEGPCRDMADQRIVFGANWTRFKSIADSGDLPSGGRRPRTSGATGDGTAPLIVPVMATVVQNVVVYPDESAARVTFDRHVAAMEECVDLNLPHLGGTISRPNQDEVVLLNSGFVSVFSVKSTIIVDVSVVALPDAERIASAISRAILDRVD
ncbi:hypothetical protein AU189_11635 [Mycolicibacterium acapulense]|uniref:sensor domain-containing protein n=1 Tax=Mycobacterium lehmannii TaxID=2048550 RepID=UPI0007469072|nr:sensor domain-containing protein [Mycobacterium lehmannii]KUH99469.1 hypothetical protein AU189_11635 [Mycolicibacterium acapulense]KUI15241.1 hypothetical protein AU191_01885 [Mycolicibacterium acapulense]